MIGKKNKYIVIDRELEESFLVGDLKVVGAIIGVSHRKIVRYFTGTNFRDEERFIVAKNPHEVKSRHGGKMSEGFLQYRFKKKALKSE